MNKKILKITSSMLLCTMLAYTTPIFAYTKEETVYSKLNADGENYETIVNAHIKNTEQAQLINDISDLMDIENINGDEEFTKEGENVVWNAEGNDIYYSGNTNKELPLECKVKYELNGEEISKDDIIGRSGNVKVTIEYINKDEHIVKVNGKNKKLYTPFVAICGTVIKHENNKNIQITNGKVIDDGEKTILLGICLPGMQESLSLGSKIDIPSKIEITMETTDFKLNNIITYVTPKIIEDDNLEVFDKLDEIYENVNVLQTSSEQLEEGADTLKQGTQIYSEKSQEFNTAIKQISNGVSSANENYTKINDGINSLNKNSDAIQIGAKTINEGTVLISTNIKTISEKLGELQIGTKQLQTGETQLVKGIDQILQELSNMKITDNTTKIKELEKLVNTNQNTIQNLKQANVKLNEQLKLATDNKTIETLKTRNRNK